MIKKNVNKIYIKTWHRKKSRNFVFTINCSKAFMLETRANNFWARGQGQISSFIMLYDTLIYGIGLKTGHIIVVTLYVNGYTWSVMYKR